MKKTPIFRSLLLAATSLCAIAFNNTGYAQCLSNNIIINTGYDPSTGGAIPPGSQSPLWKVTGLTPALASQTADIVPFDAYAPSAARPTSYATPPADARWINYENQWESLLNSTFLDYTMTFRYEFRLCSDDSVTLDVQIASDNYVRAVRFDDPTPVATDFVSASTSPTNFALNPLTPVTRFMTAGIHYIEIEVTNIYSSQFQQNAQGLLVVGAVKSLSNSLVSPACPEYVCENECDDRCYWRVIGNNISSGKNVFGTLTSDDVRIQTSANNRGVFTANGLLGWNTMNPTAYLHVNCTGNNADERFDDLSDVRFENLEEGRGYILVIDDKGYVKKSRIHIQQFGGKPAPSEEPETTIDRTAALEKEVAELKAQIATLIPPPPQGNGCSLSQNVPNPFTGTTDITYTISGMKSEAFILLLDLNGKELKRYPLSGNGTSRISINSSGLSSGIYLYSLLVDGLEIDTKRMVLSR